MLARLMGLRVARKRESRGHGPRRLGPRCRADERRLIFREVWHSEAVRIRGLHPPTAKDQAGNTVVIELKPGKAGKNAVAQLLAYMGEVKAAQNPSGLRGILVAYDFQANAVAAASVVPNIALKCCPSDVRNSVAANPPTPDAANSY